MMDEPVSSWVQEIFDRSPWQIPRLVTKIVDPANAFAVARVPVLDRGILDLCVVVSYDLHDRRMQLVFVPLRRRASLQVGDIRVFVRYDKGSFELSRSGFIDSEIGGQFNRALHAFRDIAKEPSEKTAEFRAAKKLSVWGTTLPRYFWISSG